MHTRILDVEALMLKFFNKYADLFDESKCASTGDSDDVLMSLMMMIDQDNLQDVIKYLNKTKGA